MARSPLRALSTLACILGLLAGCNSSPIGKTYSVKGQVLVDGKPLTGCFGRIQFVPDKSKGNTNEFDTSAHLAEDGTYTIETHSVQGNKTGALPGWYKVAVTAEALVDGKRPPKRLSMTRKTKHMVQRKYEGVQTSGLEIEVVANPAPGAYDLRLDP